MPRITPFLLVVAGFATSSGPARACGDGGGGSYYEGELLGNAVIQCKGDCDVAWATDEGTTVAALDAAGVPIYTRVLSRPGDDPRALVRAPDASLLVSVRYDELRVTVIGDGPVLEPITLSMRVAGVAAAWDGTAFVVAWVWGQDWSSGDLNEIRYARILPSGALATPVTTLAAGADLGYSPTVASNGTETWIAWNGSEAVRGQRLDAGGLPIDAAPSELASYGEPRLAYGHDQLILFVASPYPDQFPIARILTGPGAGPTELLVPLAVDGPFSAFSTPRGWLFGWRPPTYDWVTPTITTGRVDPQLAFIDEHDVSTGLNPSFASQGDDLWVAFTRYQTEGDSTLSSVVVIRESLGAERQEQTLDAAERYLVSPSGCTVAPGRGTGVGVFAFLLVASLLGLVIVAHEVRVRVAR